MEIKIIFVNLGNTIEESQHADLDKLKERLILDKYLVAHLREDLVGDYIREFDSIKNFRNIINRISTPHGEKILVYIYSEKENIAGIINYVHDHTLSQMK